MKHKSKKLLRMMICGMIFLILSLACNLSDNLPSEATPTSTEVGGEINPTTTERNNRCEGLSGTLEMQVLVGPAEAVGLEPVAVGDIPFSVISEGGVYLVQGNGSIDYEDVLVGAWGTYTVSFDMEAELQGDCIVEEGNEILNMVVSVSGEQMVVVEADGFQGEYPWSGTHSLDLSFPVMEGAMAEGEGWAFVLHLDD